MSSAENIIKFGIIKRNEHGMRLLAFSKNAHNYFPTHIEAQDMLDDFMKKYSISDIISILGDPDTLEVQPIECYWHGEAVRRIQKNEDANG